MPRLTSHEKELLKNVLAKHQQKHPGCKLTEKRCKFKSSKDCIGKGKADEFHGRMCRPCRAVYNRQKYAERAGKK